MKNFQQLKRLSWKYGWNMDGTKFTGYNIVKRLKEPPFGLIYIRKGITIEEANRFFEELTA